MRKYHPDANRNPISVKKAQKLNDAYRCLRNPAQRSAYDALRTRKVAPRSSRPSRSSRPKRREHSPGKAEHTGKSPVAVVARTVIGVLIAATFVSIILNATDQEEGVALSQSVINAFEGDDFVPEVRVELNSSNSSSASERNEGIEGTVDRVPDNAAFEAKVATAVEDFVRVQSETGLVGAQDFSINCHQAAQPMNDVLWMDYCVAFDFSAWTLDSALRDHFDTASYSYFDDRVASYQQARFPFARAHPQRIQMIQTIVAESLFETVQRRESANSQPASTRG